MEQRYTVEQIKEKLVAAKPDRTEIDGKGGGV
jgi:hypothetical protein